MCRKLPSLVSIPFEQGDVFRLIQRLKKIFSYSLNPFRAGRCLSTEILNAIAWQGLVSIPFEQGDVFRLKQVTSRWHTSGLNPFRAGRCLSTETFVNLPLTLTSQSLSSRAMSFDPDRRRKHNSKQSQSLSSRAMSFDHLLHQMKSMSSVVSIPFEQGDVFRQKAYNWSNDLVLSQSLSSRAMSFDTESLRLEAIKDVSIPFEQGDVFRPQVALQK